MMKKNRLKILLCVTTVLLTVVSCIRPDNSYEDEREKEKEEYDQIQNYLNTNSSLNFELKSSGLYYLEIEAGSGVAPVVQDTVFLSYKATFLNGTMFDNCVPLDGDTLNFPVGDEQIIQGINEGLTYMKEGGKSLFLIPSRLAFGSYGLSITNVYIPGYTPLLYEVKLLRVKSGQLE